MLEQHQKVGQLHEAEVVLRVIVPPNGDASMIQEPSKEALDLPAPTVAPQWPPVLRFRFGAIATVWRDQLDAIALGESSVQRVTIVCASARRRLGEALA